MELNWADQLWLVPAWPALGALLIGVVLPQRARSLATSAAIAVGAVALAFVTSLILLAHLLVAPEWLFERAYTTWIQAGDLNIPVGLRLDPLSATMCTMVSGVGLLIHIYSKGYMAHDEAPARFFAYLNLFTAMMLLLVLANNFALMFVGWEGVGLCSYLLIGFWHQKESANKAGLKAFLVNRIGDCGFILGCLLIFVVFGSLTFSEVLSPDAIHAAPPAMLLAIALLLFVGATGKSAQIPLYVWLPDAMEGPTPVSALIHAATMVTAGVYMVVRCAPLYSAVPQASAVVAWIGVLTALLAGLIALGQRDIKRVLAYSTISQLGYMFLACGVGAYVAAIFHVVTHAFFKACLFLGAGSVMHGTGDRTDITQMGGLAAHMPRTSRTFWIACLSIAGIAPLAGFFSKDEILYETFISTLPTARILWVLAMLTAFLTAFYMFRLFGLTFHGASRMPKREASHVHESPPVMTWPLIILAFLAMVGGFLLGWPYPHQCHLLGAFMADWRPPAEHGAEGGGASGGLPLMVLLAALSFAVAVTGSGLAFWLFSGPYRRVQEFERRLGTAQTAFSRKFWVDELYGYTVVGPLQSLGNWLGHFVDVRIVDGLVNGVGGACQMLGEGVRRLHASRVRFYAFVMLGGAVLVVAYMLRDLMF